MDIRLESLIAAGATYKTYIRKDMAKVSIKLQNGNQYTGNGRNEEAALEKMLASIESGVKEVKHERRRRERERQALLKVARSRDFSVDDDDDTFPLEV